MGLECWEISEEIPERDRMARVSAADVGITAVDEKDLHSMMRDPRYWRDKDPSFIAKVTDGFQKIYGKN
jgi:hypothetical protein